MSEALSGTTMSKAPISFADFPQDVVDEVIGWLPPLAGRYASCGSHHVALVCKSWLAPARRNLFYFVQIWPQRRLKDGSTRLGRILKTIDSSPEIAKYIRTIDWHWLDYKPDLTINDEFPAQTLQQLAQITNENNIKHIWNLGMFDAAAQAQFLGQVLDRVPVMAQHVAKVHWHCSLPWGTRSSVWLDIILGLIRQLPALHHLELMQHQSPEEPFSYPALSQALAQSTCRITLLELPFAAFSSEIELLSFLAGLKSLAQLKFGTVDIVDGETATTHKLQEIGPVPPLRNLDISAPSAGALCLMRWLEANSRLGALTTMTIPSEQTVASYLAQCHGVETLDLTCSISDYWDGTTAWGSADLSGCIQLHHLVITASGPACPQMFSATLGSIPDDTALAHLRLIMYERPDSEDGWSVLSQALNRPCFARLYDLLICTPDSDRGDTGMLRARKELSEIDRHGNVRFTSRGPNADMHDLFEAHGTSASRQKPAAAQAWSWSSFWSLISRFIRTLLRTFGLSS